MSLQTIYVVRHAFRSSWSVDLQGNYTALLPSPTGIAADPALTSHGLKQAKELGHHLTTLKTPIEAIYSSPYYRCLQTLIPFTDLQAKRKDSGDLSLCASSAVSIRAEAGFCEWFGSAAFEHPRPAEPALLKELVPAYDESYVANIKPSVHGETYTQLRDRVAAALAAVIAQCDAEGKTSIILCTHAAVVIVLGRILTGEHPEHMETEDFRAFTCGLSLYTRSKQTRLSANGISYPGVGTWVCERNSDCSFLSGGEERGWKFAGDESFPGTGSMSGSDVESKL